MSHDPLLLPPYGHFLGIEMDDGDGGLIFRMPFAPALVGRPNFVHGGAIAGLLEIAAVGTLRAALAREQTVARVKTITVTTDFMRGGREQDTFAAATISRLGTRIANVEAVAWQDSRDRPIAGAHMNLIVRREA